MSAFDSLRAYYRPDLDLPDFQSFAQEVNGQSDRATVILLAGALDAALMAAIVGHFPTEMRIESKLKHAFRLEGPLGSFSARIDVALLFRVIDERMRMELDTIRELRNACAHSQRAISFETPEVVAVLSRVLHPRGSTKLKEDSRGGRRAAFIAECATLYQKLFGERMSLLSAILGQVSDRPNMPIEDFTKLAKG